VVTAAGELVRADAAQNSDLYWAARGAGPGFFGVVTCFHLRTRPIPPAIFASAFVYPAQYGAKVLQWLQETHGTMHPDIEIVSVGQVLPQIEGVEGRDIPVQIVHGMAFAATEAAAARMLEPLTSCPVLDKAYAYKICFPTSVEQEIKEQIRMNPEGHRCAVNNAWLTGTPEEVSRTIAPSFSNLPTPKTFTLWYSMAPLRPLPDMAFSLQTDIYMALYVIWEEDADDERCRNWLKTQMKRLEPVTAGQYLGDSDFINFPRKFMAEANFERLQQIRAQRDPSGLFHAYLANPDATLNQNPWAASEIRNPPSENLKPHHVGISVRNMDESIAWYGQHLGFKLLWQQDFPAIQTKIAFLQQGDFKIELFEHHETVPLADDRKDVLTDIKVQGTKHICFETGDLKPLYEKLEAQGVDIAMSLRKSPPGDAWMCFVRDPTGNLIEIIEII
jgi:catechol 2,3-dioxygenase-like lactoylglutathione lyase family enzyme